MQKIHNFYEVFHDVDLRDLQCYLQKSWVLLSGLINSAARVSSRKTSGVGQVFSWRIEEQDITKI